VGRSSSISLNTHSSACSYRNEVGILNINDAGPAGGEDIFGYGEAFVDGIPENAPPDGQPFFVPRRHRGVGEFQDLFGVKQLLILLW
jgi:hypothetical protein